MESSRYNFTENSGIDYGLGTANVDKETGIRYGILPLSACNEFILESFEPCYGEPSCPNCGQEDVKDLDSDDRYAGFDFTAQCGVYQCTQCSELWYPMELVAELDSSVSPCCLQEVELVKFKSNREYSTYRASEDYACLQCKLLFPSEDSTPEEPYSYTYERDGYILELDSSNDIWIFKAPYATWSQFCSPCAPGACYISNPTRPETGGFAYALGNDFFDQRKEGSTLPEDSTEDTESTEGRETEQYKAYRPYPLYTLDGVRIPD